jgi:hypothetical protein
MIFEFLDILCNINSKFSIYILNKKIIYIHTVSIHHWPHGKSYQDLNLGLEGNNPLPLPSNDLIWFETNEVMIIFNTFFIPNVLQKPHLTKKKIILCPNEKKKTKI